MTETSVGEAAAHELEAVLADIEAHPWPADIAEARALYDSMGPRIGADIGVQPVSFDTITGQLLVPPSVEDDRGLLFLHGGGYVYGSLQSHGGMAGEVARASRCRCLQLRYRLAPEHPFPAAVEDACDAYKALLRMGLDSHRLALVGDSAGGGLVMSTLLALKEKGIALPGCAVCISPWVDLAATGESYESRQSLDPMIDRSLVHMLAGLYLNGRDPRLPLASPIYADLAGLPPLLIQVGEREVLFNDAERLADKARRCGVDVTFEQWPQMVHVWHLYYPSLRAAREAITRLGAFVRAKTVANDQSQL